MSIIGLKSTSCRRWIKYNLSIASNTKEKGEGVRGEKNKQTKKKSTQGDNSITRAHDSGTDAQITLQILVQSSRSCQISHYFKQWKIDSEALAK